MRFALFALLLAGCSEYGFGSTKKSKSDPPKIVDTDVPKDTDTPEDTDTAVDTGQMVCEFPVTLSNGAVLQMENELVISPNTNTPGGNVVISDSSEVMLIDLTAVHSGCPSVTLNALSWGWLETGDGTLVNQGIDLNFEFQDTGWIFNLGAENLLWDNGRTWLYTHNVIRGGETLVISVQFDLTRYPPGPAPDIQFYISPNRTSWSAGASSINPEANAEVLGNNVSLVWP